MILTELLERVGSLVSGDPAAPIAPTAARRQVTGVEYDSRQVSAGSLFVALRGQRADGVTFAQQAVVKGAVAIRSASMMQPEIDLAAREGLMPDVRGLSAREALRVLARVGVEARITGDGFVATQGIVPGTPLERGRVCALVLRRQLIPIAGDTGTQE